jgi:predicted transcriptional regulator
MDEKVLALAAQIVSAHASNNTVPTEQLPELIRQVHHALVTVGQESTEPSRVEPAVPVRKSVFGDHIVCLECGKHFSMLKRHLMTDHNLSVQQYRSKWGLPMTYPLVAPDYAKVRSALAKKIGLGQKRTGPARKAPRKSGRA